MTKRVAVGKGLRFDIFRRDQFACRYCGRRPPEVILEIDHLIPVVSGGDNNEENLLTSCEECNRGKSAKALSSSPPLADVDARFLEVEQEAGEMMRYLRSKEIRDNALDEVVRSLSHTWCAASQTNWYPIALPTWVRIFGPELVESALLAVAPKWLRGQLKTPLDATKYIRGTLNRMGSQTGMKT